MEYDPLLTMAALNFAVVSLHKITSTGDRAVLDRSETFSKNPVKWLGRLAVSCVSEYFRSKVEAELQYERGQLRLRQEELNEYDALQRKLLDSLWKLLRQYKLPDSYRLTQKGLDNFYMALLFRDVSGLVLAVQYSIT